MFCTASAGDGLGTQRKEQASRKDQVTKPSLAGLVKGESFALCGPGKQRNWREKKVKPELHAQEWRGNPHSPNTALVKVCAVKDGGEDSSAGELRKRKDVSC